jgi:hypothetical protein
MANSSAALKRQANSDIIDQNDATMVDCESEHSQSAEIEEETIVKRFVKRNAASPSIVINRNGSRYIAPIDIVRSKVGRAEILKQTSQRSDGTQTVLRDSDRRDKTSR